MFKALLLAAALYGLCDQRESVGLTIGAKSAPCWPPWGVCGISSLAGYDALKVPMDFHSTWLLEGEVQLQLRSNLPVPVELTVLEPAVTGGYRLVGRWKGIGCINTGEFPVLYHHQLANHLLVFSQVQAPFPADYRLSYR